MPLPRRHRRLARRDGEPVYEGIGLYGLAKLPLHVVPARGAT
jgi:hypothetical protein